jgi:choline monooxygenase
MVEMNKSLRDFFDQEQIDSIRRPIESALTFPAKAFTSEEFLELEIEKVYKGNWVACLFDLEIPNQGDIKPFDICGIPLLAVRGNDSVVRVFHNIVPYDGCLAAIDPAEGCESIETPYHGWTYDLQGKLIKIPFWDGTRDGKLESVEGKSVDLVPVHTEVILNTIFVNLSDNPENFSDYISPIIQDLHEFDLSIGAAGQNADGEAIIAEGRVKTNWKTHFENACINVLHENFVHDFYRASSQVPRIDRDGVPSFENSINGKWMALTYDREYFKDTYPEQEGAHLGKSADLEPKTENFGTLYPNFYLSASSKFLEVAYVMPNGAGESVQRAIYIFHKDVAKDPELSPERQELADIFAAAYAEDGRVTEAVQKARRSPIYDQKFYAPFWDEMHHHFSNLLLNELDA